MKALHAFEKNVSLRYHIAVIMYMVLKYQVVIGLTIVFTFFYLITDFRLLVLSVIDIKVSKLPISTF